jgi:hypothetical protein
MAEGGGGGQTASPVQKTIERTELAEQSLGHIFWGAGDQEGDHEKVLE